MSSFFGGGDEKEAERQEDIARQNEESQAILNQFLAQLVPGSEEYNQLQSEGLSLVRATAQEGDQQDLIRQLGTRLVSQQQARIAAGGPATALESRTQKAFEGLRGASAFTPEELAVLNALRGTPGSEEPGAASGTSDIFSTLVSRARSPEEFFQSTFQPQLQLLQESVKSRAASRGILGSGLELEHLGRAGVELAIQEAQQREAFRQNQLSNFLNLFNVGQQLREREIGTEEAFTNLQLGRESRLTDLLGQQTATRGTDLVDLLRRQTGRSEDLADSATARAQSERDAFGQALGKVLGGTIGFAVGGPAGAAIGSGAGGLLSSQQASSPSGGPRQLSSSLSRSPTQLGQLSPEELARLLALTGGGNG